MANRYKLYANLEILDMANNKHIEKLVSHLQPEYGSTHAVQNILYKMLGRGPSGGIAKCKTVIVESDYVDNEFSSCYGRFYYHLFQNISKTCKRLHFFAEPIHRADLPNLECREGYLGYVVLRPISAMPIGRTVLSPMVKSRHKEFILTQEDYKVNLSGSTLSVSGMPFIQQDGRVAACASAALWMATSYLSPKYNLANKSSIEITELATGYDFTQSRSIPGRGLTIPQMLNSLSAMGYSPQLYDHPWPEEAKQTIYSCVESKIPALLALSFKEGHHALVAIGHTFSSPKMPTRHREIIRVNKGHKSTYYDNIEWIPAFIVHDDQGGLYGKLRILQLENFVKKTKKGKATNRIDVEKLPLPPGVEPSTSEVHCPIEVEFSYRDPMFSERRLGNLFAIIMPMPPGVSLLAEDARRKARELMIVTSVLYGSPQLSEIILRTYLDSSNSYKESLKYRDKMPAWLKQFYRGKPMSKYIWVTEISNRDLFDKANVEDRQMIGEIIMDSAASPYTPSFIAIHVPGYVMSMTPGDTNYVEALVRAKNLSDDHPYAHASRV